MKEANQHSQAPKHQTTSGHRSGEGEFSPVSGAPVNGNLV
jgi:hypothetical protein